MNTMLANKVLISRPVFFNLKKKKKIEPKMPWTYSILCNVIDKRIILGLW